LLALSDIDAGYGDSTVLHGISLVVDSGDAVCVMGPNGAGKTTLLKVIAGILPPRRGSIHWEGERLDGRPVRHTVQAGISLVPEGRHIFQGLTIRENLLLGAYSRHDRAAIEADIEVMYEIFPILYERRRSLGRTLSGGQQQMLAIARGLMSRPRLLLLDEPSLGLAPIVVNELPTVLRRAQALFDTAILIVEQNASLALGVASRGFVIETGRVRFSGSTEEMRVVVEADGLLSAGRTG
jgi:branched-chain amino acid transport system ATP-binding protein